MNSPGEGMATRTVSALAGQLGTIKVLQGTYRYLPRPASTGLPNQPRSFRQPSSRNGDDEITVDEILKAVDNALNGC
jgi:hypothetical protein